VKPKLTHLIIPLLLVMLTIGGCNIFGWSSKESPESLIDEGKRYMREGEYDEAVEKFAKAMEEDPDNSDARYYHAKATIHASGFNALYLGKIMSESDFIDGELFPFTGNDWSDEKASRLFQAVKTVYVDLSPIYHNQTTGGFDSTDIDLDLGLATGIQGILTFQDTDLDGIISPLDFDLDIKYFQFGENEGFAIVNLNDYIQNFQGVGKLAGGEAATPTPIPQDLIDAFNTLIDSIDVIIQYSLAIIMDIVSEELDLDPEEVEAVLDEVILVAQHYKIETGIDNDGDGRIDEEIVNGLDDDGDGWIDEDSDGTYEF
jgi:tetratricopeptide (TPR) repeat protein